MSEKFYVLDRSEFLVSTKRHISVSDHFWKTVK